MFLERYSYLLVCYLNNIKMYIPEKGWVVMDWIYLAEDRDEYECGSKFYYMAEMYFWIAQNAGNSRLTVDLLASQKRLCCMELFI